MPFIAANLTFESNTDGEAGVSVGNEWLVDCGAMITIAHSSLSDILKLTDDNSSFTPTAIRGLSESTTALVAKPYDEEGRLVFDVGGCEVPIDRIAFQDTEPPFAVGLDFLRHGTLQLDPRGGADSSWGSFTVHAPADSAGGGAEPRTVRGRAAVEHRDGVGAAASSAQPGPSCSRDASSGSLSKRSIAPSRFATQAPGGGSS